MHRSPRVLAVEGPDGAGKTSIIRRLSERLGATAVAPFSGEVGAAMRALHESGDYEHVHRMALDTLAGILAGQRDTPALVFDRHWLSVLAFTAPRFLPLWRPLPPTIVCLAEPTVIKARLEARGTTAEELAASDGIVARYRALAAEHGLTVIDTGGATVEESVARMLALWDLRVGAPAG